MHYVSRERGRKATPTRMQLRPNVVNPAITGEIERECAGHRLAVDKRDNHLQACAIAAGEQSVKILVDKILHSKNPPSDHVFGKLTRVTKENVAKGDVG